MLLEHHRHPEKPRFSGHLRRASLSSARRHALLGSLALLLLSQGACSSDASDSVEDPNQSTTPPAAGGAESVPGGGAGGTTAGPGTSGGAESSTGGTESSTGGEPSTIVDPVAGGDPDKLVGLFTAILLKGTGDASEGFTSVQGYVRTAPTYSSIIWELVSSEGGCDLVTPRYASCLDPSCETSETCVEDATCVPNAEARSAGIVTFNGLDIKEGGSEFTIEARSPRFNYLPPSGVEVVYPPAAEGAEVTVSSEGGDYAPFTITTKGIAPLVVTSGEEVPLAPGQPIQLSWEAAGAGADSRIEVDVDISHHGGVKGKIVCEVEDNGALEISSEMVDSLVALGLAGFPAIRLTRKSVGSALLEHGRVDFELLDHTDLPIIIDGLTSCSGDEDCPEGSSCQASLSCE